MNELGLVDGKEIIPVMDWRDIRDDHKQAATEIAAFLENSNQPELANAVREKFKLVEKQKYDLSKSKFIKSLDDNAINYQIQGFVENEGILYPLILLCEDIRRFDDYIKSFQAAP
jgi:hypothetical protein